MIKIVILGAGNVATHLLAAFQNTSNLEVVQLYNRTPKALQSISFLGSKTTQLKQLKEADCYILALADDAISTLSQKLPFQNKLVVHTSGSVPLNDLCSKNQRGVFYPLQTFSKEREVDFKNIPICLEAENNTNYQLLESIAYCVSNKVFNINSEKRKQVHLAAVFVCNFVNYLYHIGQEITSKNNIPFSILHPLIQETAAKIENNTPASMQTGPAKRNDQKTLRKHLDLLESAHQIEIYTLLSKAITQMYGREKL